MRAFLAAMLAVFMLIPCAGFGEEITEEITEETPEEIRLLSNPLPIDFTGGLEPLEECYQGDTVYEDPTIRVEITYKDVRKYVRGYKGDAGAWIVDIHVGHASQLRCAAAESFSVDTTQNAEEIAERVNAVAAFNGDYIARQKDGIVFRQGTMFKDKLKGKRDILLVDEDGDFHPVHLAERGSFTGTVDGKKVINVFCFGPILVENGQALQKMPSFAHLDPDEYYARIAICQAGPLHYKMILTTFKQGYATLGLPLKAFAQLCMDEGAITAYNLDGGMSTTLYFHGKRVNAEDRINNRDVPDIVYFASAWDGGKTE